MKPPLPAIAATGAKRRSTRVAHAVPLVIAWTGPRSKPVSEETSTRTINCHGCQYFSRHGIRKNTKVDLQIGGNKNLKSAPRAIPARVAWVRKSRRLGGMYQVGVEFDTPQDVWHIGAAPEDWGSFSTAPPEEDSAVLIAEVERLLRFAHEGNHYELLQVDRDATRPQIKRQFYHLASRFHPDHHMDHPGCTPRLVELMDSLTNAYRTLSGEESRAQYDERVAWRPQESPEPRQSARACFEKSRECLAVKNYVGSILWLRRAIEAEPESSGYRAMLGHCLAAIPEYRHEAVEQFEKAIELDPSNLAAHFQYAQMLERMKMPWRARPHYLRVLELDMEHREARERLNRIDSAAPRPSLRPSLLSRWTGRR